MAVQAQRVGFIGLGRMGAAIARNIHKAGLDLTVYNRSAAKMQPFAAAGVATATSPADLAAQIDVVVSCLLDDKSVLESVAGDDGLLAGLRPGGIHIGTTTISPGCATRLAELHAARGTYYVAGPVVGRPDAAEAGTLVTLVAGDKDAVDACQAVLKAYTRSITYVGPEHRVANTLKLAINFMVISMVELMGEAYAFADKNGVDLELLHQQVLMVLDHPALRGYAERIPQRRFDDAAFELSSGFKDVQLMLQASTDARAPLPFASVIRDKFVTALAYCMEHKDWSAIYEITRLQAGLR